MIFDITICYEYTRVERIDHLRTSSGNEIDYHFSKVNTDNYEFYHIYVGF